MIFWQGEGEKEGVKKAGGGGGGGVGRGLYEDGSNRGKKKKLLERISLEVLLSFFPPLFALERRRKTSVVFAFCFEYIFSSSVFLPFSLYLRAWLFQVMGVN